MINDIFIILKEVIKYNGNELSNLDNYKFCS